VSHFGRSVTHAYPSALLRYSPFDVPGDFLIEALFSKLAVMEPGERIENRRVI
jgi:hypothetical protein